MGKHQISKYPLTAAQIKAYGLTSAPKLKPAVFKGCGHSAQIFENADVNLDGSCWACQKRF
jgi:hypothetical protein